VRKADNLQPSCADVKKSVGLNLLEPCGSVQACNGTALPLHLHKSVCMCMKTKKQVRAVMCQVGSLDIANFTCQLTTALIMEGMAAFKHNYSSQ
jgi:hypothetical protein